MDNFQSRLCNYTQDIEQIVTVLLSYRAATTVHVYPTAWRLRLLLSSRVWEPEQDTRVWQDASGRMVAFAMLWRRRSTSPYLVFERVVDPVRATADLVTNMLAWGKERASTLAAKSSHPLILYASQLAAPPQVDSQLEAYGFVYDEPDPEAHNVYFERPLTTTLPEPLLPTGYVIRPVQSASELEDYGGLYDFTAVSPQHRQEMFSSNEYGHLVVVDPAGQFVAYCEYSLCRAEWQQSGQRLGWIDYIGTHPESRQRGLGRAVLWASLHHMQALGAETAVLITVSTNHPAIKLYEATGFTRLKIVEAPSYKQEFS